MRLNRKQYLEMQEKLFKDNWYRFRPSEFVECELLLKETKLGLRVFTLNNNGFCPERILLGEVSVDMGNTIDKVDMETIYHMLVFKFVGLVYRECGLEQ